MKTLALLLVVAACAQPAAATVPPGPDPVPGTGNAPIVYVGYWYETPAYSKKTGKRIPHLWFRCVVPAVHDGHVNVAGWRHCRKFRR